ncbi:MAG: hypothetical protein R2730_14460 [Chitinophagales bacterium]
MEVLDQVKEKVEAVVTEVKENVTGVQGKAEEQYGKFVENYKSAAEKLKGEYAHQTTTLKGYKERLSTKFSKHFNTKEIVADLKEEVDFFKGEFKNNIERVKAAVKK